MARRNFRNYLKSLRRNKMEKRIKIMKEFWDGEIKKNPYEFLASEKKNWNPEDYFAQGRSEAAKALKTEFYQPESEHRMLEIGCGAGRLIYFFADMFKEVHGTDISEYLLGMAKERCKEKNNVFLKLGNGIDLSCYRSEYFDFCLSNEVFYLIPEEEIILNYIREAGRVLNKNGIFRFQISTAKKTLLKKFKDLFADILYSIGIREIFGKKTSRAWNMQEVNVEKIKETINNSNMRILEVSGVGTYYTWFTCIKC